MTIYIFISTFYLIQNVASRSQLPAKQRIREIQEEIADFLLDEVIAPIGEYHENP